MSLEGSSALVWFEQVDVRRLVEVIGGRAFVVAESESIVGSVPGTEELECASCGALVASQEGSVGWSEMVEHGSEEEVQKTKSRGKRIDAGRREAVAEGHSLHGDPRRGVGSRAR
jgi:hypothetical protein